LQPHTLLKKMQGALMLHPRLALFATLLAFAVVLLGAYVRLSDAGLGCPDWPGCYGAALVPSEAAQVASANLAFPQRPLDASKAWKEMLHRYLASSLGLVIVLLAIIAWRKRRQRPQPTRLAALLLLLVIVQGLLGMWTVTLLVKPVVVTLHLLGGISTVALLWLLTLRLTWPDTGMRRETEPQWLRHLVSVAVMILAVQIALGGWTSSNYAAIACSDFPTCVQGRWWPEVDFREAFILWRGTTINYEYGVLDSAARATIHITHRIGAALTLFSIGLLCITLLQRGSGHVTRRLAWLLATLLLLQITLGIGNVLGHLPLAVAVAHNGTAALLMVVLVTLWWWLSSANDG